MKKNVEVKRENGRVYKFGKSDKIVGILLSSTEDSLEVLNILDINGEQVSLPIDTKAEYVHVPTVLKSYVDNVAHSYVQYSNVLAHKEGIENSLNEIEEKLKSVENYNSFIESDTFDFKEGTTNIGWKIGTFKKFVFSENIDELNKSYSVLGVIVGVQYSSYVVYTLDKHFVTVPKNYVTIDVKMKKEDTQFLYEVSELFSEKCKCVRDIKRADKEVEEFKRKFERVTHSLVIKCKNYTLEDFVVISDLFDEDLPYHPKDFLETFMRSMSERKKNKLLYNYLYDVSLQTSEKKDSAIFNLKFKLKLLVARESDFIHYPFIVEKLTEDHTKKSKNKEVEIKVKYSIDRNEPNYNYMLNSFADKYGRKVDVRKGIMRYRPPYCYGYTDSFLPIVLGNEDQMLLEHCSFVIEKDSLVYKESFIIQMDLKYLTEEVAKDIVRYIKVK